MQIVDFDFANIGDLGNAMKSLYIVVVAQLLLIGLLKSGSIN